MKCADEAVQMHGGYGYLDEYRVQRLYGDAKIVEIYEGVKEIENTIVARSLWGSEGMASLQDSPRNIFHAI